MKFNGKYTRPTRAEVEQRLHKIGEQIKETSPGEEYFDLLREQSKLSLELDDYAFDFHEPDLEKAGVSFQRSQDQRAKLTPEQLIAEVDKLIDKNPSQSELDALLPYIADMAGRHTLDVRRLYDSRLAELEDSDSREDLKRDLDDLLAIGGVSLGYCQLNRNCSKLSTIIPESSGDLRLCGRIQPSNFSPIFNSLAQLFAVALGS